MVHRCHRLAPLFPFATFPKLVGMKQVKVSTPALSEARPPLRRGTGAPAPRANTVWSSQAL